MRKWRILANCLTISIISSMFFPMELDRDVHKRFSYEQIPSISVLEVDVTGVSEEEIVEEEEPKFRFSDEELKYLAQCVEAEAGNQGYNGKVYVCDCVLNRYDKGGYDSLLDVINEKSQFSCVSDGHINNTPSEETWEVVYN